jgi:hypothetical protein
MKRCGLLCVPEANKISISYVTYLRISRDSELNVDSINLVQEIHQISTFNDYAEALYKYYYQTWMF